MNRFNRCILLTCWGAAITLAAGASAGSDEVRLREELEQVLIRLAQGGHLSGGDVSVEVPARRVANFGALIDRDGDQGLLVLGVLPGGSAESLGLRSGDRLLAANAVELTGAGGSDRLRDLLSVLDDGEALGLQVERGGQTLGLAGVMEVHDLPAAQLSLSAAPRSAGPGDHADPDSRCARISIFPAAPKARDLFPVTAISIDGSSGSPEQDSFRVEPGRRQITVGENIDSHWFSSVANRQRVSNSRERYKSLSIDAQPGTTYFIAARFHRDRAGRISEGDYWEPVVWKQRAEHCR